MKNIKMVKGKKVEENEKEKPGNIMANIEIMKGQYCNAALIKHSKTEFIFDFAMTEAGQGHLVSKIITNPIHAKQILEALKNNIEKYEEKFGAIEI